MVFGEEGNGGSVVSGRAVVCLGPAFGVGDTAYNIDKARGGRLEKVVIKLIRPVKPRKLPVANKVLYQDTFNALWNEYDLVSIDEAVALAEAYWQKVAEEADKLIPC